MHLQQQEEERRDKLPAHTIEIHSVTASVSESNYIAQCLNVILLQQLLSAICWTSGEFIFQLDSAAAHRVLVLKACLLPMTLPHVIWPPCVADADIIFCPVSSSFFIPRLISAVADWMFTILIHIVRQ